MYKILLQEELKDGTVRTRISHAVSLYPSIYDIRTKERMNVEEILKKIRIYHGLELCMINPAYYVDLKEAEEKFYKHLDINPKHKCTNCNEYMISEGYHDWPFDSYHFTCPHCGKEDCIGAEYFECFDEVG